MEALKDMWKISRRDPFAAIVYERNAFPSAGPGASVYLSASSTKIQVGFRFEA